MSGTSGQLLRSRRFLPVFITQFLGAFNDNLFKNALAILITYRAVAGEDPRFLVTLAAGLFILPFFLFSATAGQVADKYDKARVIRIIKLAEITVMAAAGIGFYLGDTWFLLAVLFFLGLHSTFFGPLKYSILPDHLREDELISANALVEAGTFLAILIGTIAGGLLVLKDNGLLMISLLALAVSVCGWLSSRFIPAAPPADAALRITPNIFRETAGLIRRAAQDRQVFSAVLGISWFWLLGFTFLAQLPFYGRAVLQADEHVVTLLLTMFSIGIALGSLICSKLLKGKISTLYTPLGIIGMSLSIAALWLLSPPGGEAAVLTGVGVFLSQTRSLCILAAFVSIAVFSGIYIVPLYTLMQSRSERHQRSRIIAANNIMNAIFMVAGAVATIAVLKAVSVTGLFLILGLINLPAAFFFYRLGRPSR